MAHDHVHDCSHLKEALGEYLDGEVESELCQELKRHLAECERCRIVVDSTRKTIRFYSEQTPFELPEDVSRRLQEALQRRLGDA